MGSSSSDSESERRHKSKKGHKKTKKRYRNKSDDDEKGYKKFKRKKEKKSKKEKANLDGYGVPIPTPVVVPEVSNEPETSENYGPALPPHLAERKIGPTIPENFKPSEASYEKAPFEEAPSIDEDLDDAVGPLPGVSNPSLEQRALEIKLGHVSESGSKEAGRESWMIELPQVKGVADLGLTARQFRTRERPDFSDRSDWTDTPAERERKKDNKKPEKDPKYEEEKRLAAKRDEEQEKAAKEHKKKRNKSLMDLHAEKLKKAKKEQAEESQGRRPFDRNVDLQANRFDEAQKKAIVKKAQLLDSRFSSGASKYL